MRFIALLACLLTTHPLAQAADPVLLKNGRELYASYAGITGVDGTDRDLRALFKLNADRFPKQGAPEELSSGVVLGMTEVGALFCKKAIEKEINLAFGQRLIFNQVDFKRAPSQFEGSRKDALVEHMAMAFWMRQPTDAEKQVLGGIVTAAAKDSNTPEDTEKVALIACTAFATSLAVLTK